MKIRLLSEADLATRVEWMNNPAVYRTMHFTPPVSLENTIEWHKKNQRTNSRYDFAFEDDNENLVAMGGLTSIDFTVRKAEFYVFVNPERQREGLGTKASFLLCKYGFDVLQLHKIYLFTNASNLGARKTYEKIGFKLEGTHRDEMVNAENYEDRLYYGLLAKDLETGNAPLDFNGVNDVILEHYMVKNRDISVVRDDVYPKIGGV